MATLETDRLWLRPITAEDSLFYLTLMNTPKWLKFIGDRKIRTEDAAREMVQNRMVAQWESHGYGNYIVLRKSGTESQQPIGCVGLFVREGLEGCDLGYAFLPEAEKQGYAFESASRLVAAAWADFRLPVLSAITDESNEDSKRLLDKLGFQFVEYVTLPNETKSIRLYKLFPPQA